MANVKRENSRAFSGGYLFPKLDSPERPKAGHFERLNLLNFGFNGGRGCGRRRSFSYHNWPFGSAAHAATAESSHRLSPWAKTGANWCSAALHSPRSRAVFRASGQISGEKTGAWALTLAHPGKTSPSATWTFMPESALVNEPCRRIRKIGGSAQELQWGQTR